MNELRMRARAGFSLAELLVALLLTSVVGAAVTGVFVTQSRFFAQQEKEGMARGVSRSAMNVLMSELRMIDRDSGVVMATPDTLRVRVPYAMGVVCAAISSPPSVVAWMFPADSFAYAEGSANFAGYAYRRETGYFRLYTPGSGNTPTPGGAATCALARIQILSAPGSAMTVPTLPSINPAPGSAIFFYQIVTYRFGPSTLVPGRRALWRRAGSGTDEELVAPFDSTARFRFFWGTESGASQASPPSPSNLSLLNGVELVLDGVSERPDPDGTFRNVPLRTAVYFKNRRP
jgi:hypothetical protein